MRISPSGWSACATASSPGARTPSSLLIRMRYGRGADTCAAGVVATAMTQAAAIRLCRNGDERNGRMLIGPMLLHGKTRKTREDTHQHRDTRKRSVSIRVCPCASVLRHGGAIAGADEQPDNDRDERE